MNEEKQEKGNETYLTQNLCSELCHSLRRDPASNIANGTEQGVTKLKNWTRNNKIQTGNSTVVDLEPDPEGSEPFCRIWIRIRIIGKD